MYTQKKPIENTHIVRERDRQRNRELLAVLFLGVPIGLFLLLFAWQNLEVIRLGREATRLQNNLKAVEVTHKSLEAELDRLTSFETVEKNAAALGFRPAAPAAIVQVRVEGRESRIERRRSRDEGRGSSVEGALPASDASPAPAESAPVVEEQPDPMAWPADAERATQLLIDPRLSTVDPDTPTLDPHDPPGGG